MTTLTPRPPLRTVLADVARAFDLEPPMLAGRSRSSRVVAARQAAMLLLREHYRLSLSAIGGLLGGRDHSTVRYGVAAAAIRCHHDADYAARVQALAPEEQPIGSEELLEELEGLARRELDGWADGELEGLLAALDALRHRAHDELARRLATPNE